MIPQVSQGLLGGNDIIGWVLQIVWLGFFVIFMFYGQRLQMTIMIRDVEKHLRRLKFMRDEGRKMAIETIKEVGKPKEDPSERVDRFLEYRVVLPQSMDPAGIVWKLDHLLDVSDVRFKDEVKLMAPEADEAQRNSLENTLGVANALNIVYKVIRHFYLFGKKTLSLYIIMQIQMILPLIMREAEAYAHALKAFATGQPIGDGAGALVAGKLMHGHKIRKIEKDIVVATVPLEGRIAHVLKAEGPGGNVGKPGDGIKQIIEEAKGKIATIVMIDAAGKLEGEKPGEVSEGVGAAIGGPGVDQFKIEESVLKYKIPVQAILIKEDIGDAYSPMRKEIFDAAETAIQSIKRLILERTKKGDAIIIAGIGNTVGIGQ
jgi:hypothetical protein